jgi:hypothetical protein
MIFMGDYRLEEELDRASVLGWSWGVRQVIGLHCWQLLLA